MIAGSLLQRLGSTASRDGPGTLLASTAGIARLTKAAAGLEPILITQIRDFDAERGTFVLDERQARKRRDWTNAEEPRPSAIRVVPTPLDAVVNDAMREWLQRNGLTRGAIEAVGRSLDRLQVLDQVGLLLV